MTTDKVLQQLVWIKWLLVVMAVGVSISTVSWLWSDYRVIEYRAEHNEEFTKKASRLLSEGKPTEVIPLAQKHIKDQPQDAYGPWFLALANYRLGNFQEASRWLSRAQELAPVWETKYIEPFRAAIKRKQGEANTQPKAK